MSVQEKTRITVDIFGTSYTIVGRSNVNHLQMIAKHVNDQMHHISNAFPNMESSKIGVLTAVNITDECFKLGKELEQFQTEQAKIEQAEIKMQKALERNQHLEQNFNSLQAKYVQAVEKLEKMESEHVQLQSLKSEVESLKAELERELQQHSNRQSHDQNLVNEYEKLKSEYELLKSEYNEWIQLVMDKEEPQQ